MAGCEGSHLRPCRSSPCAHQFRDSVVVQAHMELVAIACRSTSAGGWRQPADRAAHLGPRFDALCTSHACRKARALSRKAVPAAAAVVAMLGQGATPTATVAHRARPHPAAAAAARIAAVCSRIWRRKCVTPLCLSTPCARMCASTRVRLPRLLKGPTPARQPSRSSSSHRRSGSRHGAPCMTGCVEWGRLTAVCLAAWLRFIRGVMHVC